MAPAPVWEWTIESFRSTAASGEPMPAGVAISAVSASFALGLLAKALTVSSRRKDFTGDALRVQKLADSAKAESKRMLQYAEEDMAAFNAYMTSVRLPRATDREREDRKQAFDAAVRKAIETPMAAARAAASGINLCADAAGLVHTHVAADLGAAATLLSGALRVFLLCADSNMQQLAPDPSAYRSLMSGRLELESKAFRQANSALEHVTAKIESAARKQERKS